jgi:hypothetical protein
MLTVPPCGAIILLLLYRYVKRDFSIEQKNVRRGYLREKLLRRIFIPNINKVIIVWIKMHRGKLHN